MATEGVATEGVATSNVAIYSVDTSSVAIEGGDSGYQEGGY